LPECIRLIIARPVVMGAKSLVVAMGEIELRVQKDPAIRHISDGCRQPHHLLAAQITWAKNRSPALPLSDERATVLHHAIAELKIEFHEPLPPKPSKSPP
jgi:hypothetical protein